MRFAAWFGLFLIAGTAMPADKKSGTITGTVRYTGVVPPPKKIAATDGSTIIHNDLIVDKKTKGLKRMIDVQAGKTKDVTVE